jgi:hypothetical protein
MQKIFSLIPKVMADIDPIGKDKKNTHQGYRFRGIDDMYNSIHPALIKHGVFCVPQVQKVETSEIEANDGKVAFRTLLTIAHRFYADDGSFIEVITVGEGIDRSDKASNKAMSAAMKYCFIELFSIPTEDIEDSDKESPEAGKTKHPIKNVTRVGREFE